MRRRGISAPRIAAPSGCLRQGDMRPELVLPPLTLLDPIRLALSDHNPVLCWAGLPVNVRLCFGQPCSPFWAGGFSVHAAAWRIHIRRRAAVLSNPPRPERFRPASARNKAALGTLGSSARCSVARPLSRSLRRRSRRLRGDTRRNASSPGYRLLALRRVSPRIRRTALLHVAQFGTRPLVPCLTFHKARLSSQLLRSPTFRQLA